MGAPDDTPPRGGATYTLGEHTLVDVGEMVKRATDEVIEMRHDHDRLAGVVMRHDGQLGELLPLVKAAVAPNARAFRAAAVVGAAALVVVALSLVTLVARTSSADTTSHGQATAQK